MVNPMDKMDESVKCGDKGRSCRSQCLEGFEDSVTVKDLWLGFCQSATVHGFPFIFSSPGGIKRTVWCIFSFVCLALLLFQITTLTLLYYKYPVNVKQEWLHSTKLKFPAVTVCNTNPVKQSLLSLSPQLGSLGRKRRKRQTNTDLPGRSKRSAVDPDCSTDLHNHTNTCYWMESGLYRGSEAAAACAASSGHLAHIKDADTHQFLTDQALYGESAWISLTDEAAEGTYVWGDGSAMSWTNWDAAEPTGSSSQNCVRINTDGGWLDQGCTSNSNTYSVLCEKVPGAGATTVSALSTIDAATHDQATSTVAPTTLAQTTVAPTTLAQTTVAPTTLAQTTVAPTTLAQTTVAPTTLAQTTVAPTTLAQTTVADTTLAQTTVAPTTLAQTTVAPTTLAQTTVAPTTLAQTTVAPTTLAQTTVAPTTQEETTVATTQDAMTTEEIVQPTSIYEEREPLREDFLQETQFLEALADTPEDIKVQMGYQRNEFILDCSFAGEDCRDSDFGTFFNAVHGNCYTFNAGWNENATRTYYTSRAGRLHGLELLININQDEYLTDGNQGAGAVVTVHPAARMPFPEDEGLLARPNRLTTFELTQSAVSRLGEPYGTCVSSDLGQPELNVYEEQLPVKYTALACFKTCYQKNVIAACGCADPQYPKEGAAFGDFSGSSCDISNTTQDDCMYGVERRYISDQLNCGCQDICKDTFYPTLTSVALWPSQVELPTITGYLESVHNINMTGTDNYVSKNILKLQFYFRELNYEQTTESPKYTIATLVNSFAGSMGLFLGCTVFSVIEPFEFLYNMAFLLVHKHINKGKVYPKLLSRPYDTVSLPEEDSDQDEDETSNEDLAAKKKGLTASQIAWDDE